METEKVYAMDNSIEKDGSCIKMKFIAKSYKPNGDIIYYKDGENDDGFSNIIEDLQNGNKTLLLSNKDNMKATFEFLEELKFSVNNTTLKIVFNQGKNKEEVIFKF